MTRPTGRQRRQRRGFTLIELLTVIAILGLLLGILTSTIGAVRLRSLVQKSQLIITQLEGAIGTFHNERGQYPPSDETGYTGSEWLVQALTGQRDDDGETGWGFRDVERGRVFGPYNDTERLKVGRVPTTTKYEFLDAFDKPILYYRHDSDDGYVASHNNDGPANLDVYLRGPGNEYFRKDFVLISRGPDRKYLQVPYNQASGWDRDCDDITNFMEQ